MTTPTKFDAGAIPRSRTGLVPASFSSKMDVMSNPKHYIPLPPQPKPELYPYRGDLVNVRNRKILRERRAKDAEKRMARKASQIQHSAENTLNESDGSCTLLVTPRSAHTISIGNMVASEPEPAGPKFDTYCKHISYHALSEEEARAKSQNQRKYLSYLRDEARKRPPKKGSQQKEKKNAETNLPKQRKPPVPRLSRLARSKARKDKESQENCQSKTRPGEAKDAAQSSSENGEPTAKESKEKVRYLDFISKKEEEKPGTEKQGAGTGESKSSVNPGVGDDEDEESKFRNQIERIVQRAASLVLTEQGGKSHASDQESHVENTVNSSNPGDDCSDIRGCDEELTRRADDDVSQKQDIVCALEERVMSMQSVSSSVGESSSGFGYKSTNNMLREIEFTSSSGMESTMDGSISTTRMAGLLAVISNNFQHHIVGPSIETAGTETLGSDDEYSSCVSSRNRAGSSAMTVTSEAIARNSPSEPTRMIANAHQLDDCPEEALPLPMGLHPTSVPLARVQWEAEPLPRGYEEDAPPLPRGHEDEEPHAVRSSGSCFQGDVGGKGEGQSVLDDLFSLL